MKSDIDWISEISSLATEIQELRKQREGVRAYKLMVVLYSSLEKLSTMLWRMQYYENGLSGDTYDEKANGLHPASPIHRAVDQAKSVIFTAVLHGQLFNDIPDEIAKDAEGLFKHKN